MSNSIQVGRRLLPIEHIALIEPYVAVPDAPLRTNREFKSRIVMLNRDSVLSETEPRELAEVHAFRMLPDDLVATNPAIRFRVEEFEPTPGFTPSKTYLSRLSWTDLEGNAQSKLLVTSPAKVLSISIRGEADADAPTTTAKRPTAPRRRSKRQAQNEQA